MKYLLAICLLFSGAVLVSEVYAKEEKNSLASFPAKVKTSKKLIDYANRSDGNVEITRRSETKKNREIQKAQKVFSQNKIKRELTPLTSANAYGFEIYSAATYLNHDLDGDGFYSDFTIDFDADFEDGYADVYGVIYYSQNGGDWLELFVTDVFTIYSNDVEDEHSITLTLLNDFPTDEYDILIDLYEDGFSGVVATITPDQEVSLFALPLEDENHEITDNTSQISFVATELSGDFDNDGFFTDLTVEYDIATMFSGDDVYAEVIVKNSREGWQQILSSDYFILGNQTEFIDFTFNSGYPAGYYDVEINVIHAVTGELIADAAYEFSSLNGLPIESVNNDNFFDSFNSGSDVDIIVAGGGSLGGGLFLLTLLALRRRS